MIQATIPILTQEIQLSRAFLTQIEATSIQTGLISPLRETRSASWISYKINRGRSLKHKPTRAVNQATRAMGFRCLCQGATTVSVLAVESVSMLLILAQSLSTPQSMDRSCRFLVQTRLDPTIPSLICTPMTPQTLNSIGQVQSSWTTSQQLLIRACKCIITSQLDPSRPRALMLVSELSGLRGSREAEISWEIAARMPINIRITKEVHHEVQALGRETQQRVIASRLWAQLSWEEGALDLDKACWISKCPRSSIRPPSTRIKVTNRREWWWTHELAINTPTNGTRTNSCKNNNKCNTLPIISDKTQPPTEMQQPLIIRANHENDDPTIISTKSNQSH